MGGGGQKSRKWKVESRKLERTTTEGRGQLAAPATTKIVRKQADGESFEISILTRFAADTAGATTGSAASDGGGYN
jgi:hypothetical protein